MAPWTAVSDPPVMEGDRFDFVKNLEAGALGFVQLYFNAETEEEVAIKFLKRSAVNRYMEEKIVAHSLLKHQHLILFKECLLSNEFVGIVLEFANGGNLFDYVRSADGGRLREGVARGFFQQLMSAVEYTERKGLGNRDLTMDNTLLVKKADGGVVLKISDFAYSIHDFDSGKKCKETALPFMAPEVLADGVYDDKAADVWSCGVILFAMLFGTYPFMPSTPKGSPLTSSIKSLHEKEMTSKVSMPEGVAISPECKELLQRMLVSNPLQRISLADVLKSSWYLTDLPEEEAHLNDEVAEEDVKVMKKRQSVLDIKSLLDFALS